MRRFLIRAALIVGIVILAVEGYLLYLFYTDPSAFSDATRTPERIVGETVGECTGTRSACVQDRMSASREQQTTKTEYLNKVRDIQAKSVQLFTDSNERLRRYDALTAEDVAAMKDNTAALRGLKDQIDNLDPPEEYREHYELFRSALSALYETSKLAYRLVADPVSATQSDFEEYDQRVEQINADLQKSNEILGKDYRTLEGVQQNDL